MTERWPVTIQPVGPVAVATRIWRHRGALHVTALAKATFAFAPGEAMQLAAPMEINVAEVPGGPARTTGSWAPSDLAPLLPRADVTFVGHAYAPARTGARTVRVRLALSRPRSPGSGASEGPLLLDKSLDVVGARTATHAWPNPPAALFTRMALVYERALGGSQHHTNPIGTGIEADQRGRVHMPNVVHPPHTAVPVEPAGFAPVPAAWPLRTRMLPGLADMLRAPIASLPEGVDLSHFHAAPFDQRIEFLRGDEWIILDRLNAKHERLETRLPDVSGVARVHTRDGEEHALVMRADSLWIDGDGERCCVVWRGSFPVPSDASLPLLAIAAGVEQPGVVTQWPRIEWPPSWPEGRPHARPSSPVGDTVPFPHQPTERGPALGSTVVLEGADEGVPPTMVLSSTFVRGGTLVIDTEAALGAAAPSPLPPLAKSTNDAAPSKSGAPGEVPLARPSDARMRIDSVATGDDDTFDADSRQIGTESTLSPHEAALLSEAISLSDADLVEVMEDLATASREPREGRGEAPTAQSPAHSSQVIDKPGSEAAGPRVGASDPSRTSGVVPLSAWRDPDDDDDDDDAQTRVAGPSRAAPLDAEAAAPRREESSPMLPLVSSRTHTPPPDSVERPTSSSPETKRKGTRES